MTNERGQSNSIEGINNQMTNDTAHLWLFESETCYRQLDLTGVEKADKQLSLFEHSSSELRAE